MRTEPFRQVAQTRKRLACRIEHLRSLVSPSHLLLNLCHRVGENLARTIQEAARDVRPQK
jgi:hypothetical protein